MKELHELIEMLVSALDRHDIASAHRLGRALAEAIRPPAALYLLMPEEAAIIDTTRRAREMARQEFRAETER